MPKRGASHTIAKYKATVSAHPAVNANQNGMPWRSSAGMSKNIGRDGSTYQNVAPECAAMFPASGRSRQSQIMPRTDTRGRDATSAPMPGYRLASVDISAIRTPEIADLTMK